VSRRSGCVVVGLSVICVQKVPLRKVCQTRVLSTVPGVIILILRMNQLLCKFPERSGLIGGTMGSLAAFSRRNEMVPRLLMWA